MYMYIMSAELHFADTWGGTLGYHRAIESDGTKPEK